MRAVRKCISIFQSHSSDTIPFRRFFEPGTYLSLTFMPDIASLDKFLIPIGGQEIELQTVLHEAGGMPFLRVRIRENKRFTIFDIDPVSASRWADVMRAWASANQGAPLP